MNPSSMIPVAESIPAPWWVFEGLGLLTLTLHLLVINVVLGGSLLGLARFFTSASGQGVYEGSGLRTKIPVLLALGINLGVAPLLFVQVTYGPLIYSSSVLMATFWLAVVPVLILAYYGAYIVKLRHGQGALVKVAAAVSALFLLYVTFILVNNMTLMLQPERWAGYASNRGGTLLNLGDRLLWPRFVHMVVASVAVAGLFGALVQSWRAWRGGAGDEAVVQRGLRIFAVASALQVLVGSWQVLALPRFVRKAMMGGDMLRTVVFVFALLLALGAIFHAFRGKLRSTVIHLLATVVVMVFLRSLIRSTFLAPHFAVESLEVAPQTVPLILFLLILVAGLAVVAWMVRGVLRTTAVAGQGGER